MVVEHHVDVGLASSPERVLDLVSICDAQPYGQYHRANRTTVGGWQRMRVAGIAVHIPGSGRPAARLVVVEDSGGSPAIEEIVDFSSDAAELRSEERRVGEE